MPIQNLSQNYPKKIDTFSILTTILLDLFEFLGFPLLEQLQLLSHYHQNFLEVKDGNYILGVIYKLWLQIQPQVLCKPHYGNSHLEMVVCKWGNTPFGLQCTITLQQMK